MASQQITKYLYYYVLTYEISILLAKNIIRSNIIIKLYLFDCMCNVLTIVVPLLHNIPTYCHPGQFLL